MILRVALYAAFFIGVFSFRLFYISFANDHFDRVSRGRQILVWGAAPFRDFFDPGYFLALYSSAAMQAVFGSNLFGEALLTITFMSAGFTLAFALARQISGSWSIALACSVAAVLTLPRLYNYDKVLFLPLGLFLCWRYIARRTWARLAALAMTTAVAALYRYDTGVYIALAAIVSVLATHGGEIRQSVVRLGGYAGVVLATMAPALLFVEMTAGLDEAARQVAEYGRREALRTEMFNLPAFDIDPSAPALAIGRAIGVRWSPDVSNSARVWLERIYSLRDGVLDSGRTWLYRLTDVSDANVQALIQDRAVEDTHGIDRGETRRRLARTIAVLPGVLTIENAAAWLAWTLLVLPLIAVGCCLATRRRSELPLLVAAAVLCLSADLVILRDPLEARVGDVAAPAVPVAAWIAMCVFEGPARWSLGTTILQILIAVGLATTCTAVAVFAAPVLSFAIEGAQLRRLAESPPSTALMPAGHALGLVEYVRACTRPTDRLLATWFSPDLYFFSERGFAGGMAVFFGGHWSSAADQQTVLARLRQERVPVAIVDMRSYPEFQRDFPSIDAYLRSAYDVAAQSSFGDPEGEYRILIRKGAAQTGAGPRNGPPCFH